MKNNPKNHLLIIGMRWPEPDSSAAGSRMMQLITLFQHRNWKITFACSAQKNRHSQYLRKLGVQERKLFPNDNKASQLFKSIKPHAVLFDRFMVEEQFGWRVAETCPDALRILDTEDLHFLRKARRQAHKNKRIPTTADLQSETAKREIAALLRSDINLIISEFERDLLIEKFQFSEKSLWYLPFLVNPLKTETLKAMPDFKSRRDMLFIGNFLHPPNLDAVTYLKTEIWPWIHRKLPEIELHVYGAYMPAKIRQLQNKTDKFLVKGRAENLKHTFQQYRLLLAPLRFGAGLKGKILNAMQNGTPCVSTKIGAEGFCGEFSFSGAIADSLHDFVAKTIQLYTKENDWQKSQIHGQNLINKRFDQVLFEDEFFQKIDHWLIHIDECRRDNFLGQLLMHHRQQSTKYMSRWIETKNKLRDLQ